MKSIGLMIHVSFALIALVGGGAHAADYVWLEGESAADAVAMEAVNVRPMVFEDYVSGGKVLDMDGKLPGAGLTLSYDFNTQAGPQELWVRIGYDFDRSPFSWRLDQGTWVDVPPLTPTSNLQWVGGNGKYILGWLKLGVPEMKAGAHNLQLRWRGESALGLVDCIYVGPRGFVPNYGYRPDQEFAGEIGHQAAQHAYDLRVAPADGRIDTRLDGPWQVAPWDTTFVSEEERLRGDLELPDLEALHWYGMAVPGNIKGDQRLERAHRAIMRTRFRVPEGQEDRGYFIDLQRFCMVASVFVNGEHCGWSKNAWTAWQCDISNAVKAGENELCIVFKDGVYAYYGAKWAFTKKEEVEAQREMYAKLGNRMFWSLPFPFGNGPGIIDMPIDRDKRHGILEPLSIVSVPGDVYVTDAFCKTSVTENRLDLELEVLNSRDRAVDAKVTLEVVPWNGGEGGAVLASLSVEKTTIEPGAKALLEPSMSWQNPRLWWPDDPYLHWLRATVEVDGRVVDVKYTRFGFREIDWSTHVFKINGVKWQMWADTNYGPNAEWLTDLSKRSGMNTFRLWRDGGWGGKTRREILDYFDETGMLVRTSGILDGQVMNYSTIFAVEGPDGQKAPNMPFFDNCREQMGAWVREERNHPCVYIWSIENEIVYIASNNSRSFDIVEPQMYESWVYIHENWDPTRPVMVDGGNCLRDESMPVNGAHYTEMMGSEVGDFPDAAYSREPFYNSVQRGAWPMTRGRPIMKGEVFFANGYGTEGFAWVGGPKSFINLAATRPARGRLARIFSEGWRWCEVSAWHFWVTDADREYYSAWQPVAVLCRQWNWTFGSGESVPRTLKVFNNTSKTDPIEVEWSFNVGDKRIAGGTRTFELGRGVDQEFDVEFDVPAVATRTLAQFTLVARRNGQEVFRDEKPAFVIKPAATDAPAVAADHLVVFDPKGIVTGHLASLGIAHIAVGKPQDIPDTADVVIVGPDAITEQGAADNRWFRLASEGKKVLVLDQEHPLRLQAVPTNAAVSDKTGRIGFIENANHPVFRGLEDADFFCWGNDHILYRNAYSKGTRGGRSLVQCDARLACSALIECPVNDGVLMLSQLAMRDTLASTGVAQQVFANMLSYLAAYERVYRDAVVVLPEDDRRSALLQEQMLASQNVPDPVQALAAAPGGIAIVDATPANLRRLADARDVVDSYCEAGGWLMLWGLTPEGLADYNRIVEREHAIRRFTMEKVMLPDQRDPLMDGLTLRDVVMDTGEKVFSWMSMKMPDGDAWSYVIDHLDVAPFAELPPLEQMGVDPQSSSVAVGFDHYPPNMFNGFTWDDSWRFIYAIHLQSGYKNKWTMKLPRKEPLDTFRALFSYDIPPLVRIWLDDDADPIVAQVDPERPLEVDLGGREAGRLTVEFAEPEAARKVIGIQNIWLNVLPPERYRATTSALLNIGVLMRCNRGKGGILLNQLNVLANEKNPVNADKKRNIVKTILGNLGARFGGGKVLVTGGDNISYDPVELADNVYNEFPNVLSTRGGDMSSVPTGSQKLGDVRWQIADFATSPVPGMIVIKGQRADALPVTGIPVNKKADALFFLHTLRPGREAANWRRAYERTLSDIQRGRGGVKVPEKPTVFGYVVHYEDGTTANIAVRLLEHVDDWQQRGEVADLTDARAAWVRAFDGGVSGVLYGMQWNNPQPDKAIKSIDLVPAADGADWGMPCLFAITAGREAK